MEKERVINEFGTAAAAIAVMSGFLFGRQRRKKRPTLSEIEEKVKEYEKKYFDENTVKVWRVERTVFQLSTRKLTKDAYIFVMRRRELKHDIPSIERLLEQLKSNECFESEAHYVLYMEAKDLLDLYVNEVSVCERLLKKGMA